MLAGYVVLNGPVPYSTGTTNAAHYQNSNGYNEKKTTTTTINMNSKKQCNSRTDFSLLHSAHKRNLCVRVLDSQGITDGVTPDGLHQERRNAQEITSSHAPEVQETGNQEAERSQQTLFLTCMEHNWFCLLLVFF